MASKFFEKTKRELREYIRIFKIAKKPSVNEVKRALKICLIGTLIVGTIGGILHLILTVLAGG